MKTFHVPLMLLTGISFAADLPWTASASTWKNSGDSTWSDVSVRLGREFSWEEDFWALYVDPSLGVTYPWAGETDDVSAEPWLGLDLWLGLWELDVLSWASVVQNQSADFGAGGRLWAPTLGERARLRLGISADVARLEGWWSGVVMHLSGSRSGEGPWMESEVRYLEDASGDVQVARGRWSQSATVGSGIQGLLQGGWMWRKHAWTAGTELYLQQTWSLESGGSKGFSGSEVTPALRLGWSSPSEYWSLKIQGGWTFVASQGKKASVDEDADGAWASLQLVRHW